MAQGGLSIGFIRGPQKKKDGKETQLLRHRLHYSPYAPSCSYSATKKYAERILATPLEEKRRKR